MSAWCHKRAYGTAAASLFYDIIGELLEMQRHLGAECFGGFEVDGEHHLGREFDRQIADLRALQDLVDVRGGAPIILACVP
jgi:hypothetical protein